MHKEVRDKNLCVLQACDRNQIGPNTLQTQKRQGRADRSKLRPDGDEYAIAAAEHLKYGYRYGGYIDHFPAVVTHEEIIAEYKRLIKAKGPRFTDTKIARRPPLLFNHARMRLIVHSLPLCLKDFYESCTSVRQRVSLPTQGFEPGDIDSRSLPAATCLEVATHDPGELRIPRSACVSDPYEVPQNPEVVTDNFDIAAHRIVLKLEAIGLIA